MNVIDFISLLFVNFFSVFKNTNLLPVKSRETLFEQLYVVIIKILVINENIRKVFRLF